MTEDELAELVSRVGNVYTKEGLSPPSQLRSAAKCWLGLSHDEILTAIEGHFEQHRRFYVSGSGDQLFSLVEAAIRKAWEAKHPRLDQAEPLPPRRKRGVRQVYQAGGYPDAIDEREDEGADA
jgi:hypothetical protein